MLRLSIVSHFEDFDFRPHCYARYGATGNAFVDYEFAYRFGFELAQNQRIEDEFWLVLEIKARREWKQKHPTQDWYEYRDAVRYGWENVKNSREKAEQQFSERIRKCTVLLVDDEPDNLGVAQQILEFYGTTVLTAYDGEEALEILKTEQPTFILTDLSMPKLDGWQFLKALRANPKWQGVPVIALTAHAMRGDKEKVLANGFDQYISKPFRLGTFLADLESCLTRNLAAVA